MEIAGSASTNQPAKQIRLTKEWDVAQGMDSFALRLSGSESFDLIGILDTRACVRKWAL